MNFSVKRAGFNEQVGKLPVWPEQSCGSSHPREPWTLQASGMVPSGSDAHGLSWFFCHLDCQIFYSGHFYWCYNPSISCYCPIFVVLLLLWLFCLAIILLPCPSAAPHQAEMQEVTDSQSYGNLCPKHGSSAKPKEGVWICFRTTCGYSTHEEGMHRPCHNPRQPWTALGRVSTAFAFSSHSSKPPPITQQLS